MTPEFNCNDRSINFNQPEKLKKMPPNRGGPFEVKLRASFKSNKAALGGD